jgi:NADH dehydrogenase
MTIAVLGATGFIGRNIIEQLSQQDEPVRALYRKSSKNIETLKSYKNVELVEGDILDLASLKRLLEGADKLIHAAAVTANIKNTNNIYERVHVQGTQNVVRAAKEAGVKRIVLVSGLGTQPDKPGSYMQTRWEMEEAIRNSGIDWTIIQPSILFGKGSEFFEAQAKIIKMALVVAPVIGNGKTRFQPIYVRDVARAVIEALNSPDKIKRTVAIGGPEYFSYKELTNLMVRTLGLKRVKVYLPLPIARVQAQVFNLLPKPPLTPATLELFNFDNVTPDPQVVEHEFGFKPMDLKSYLEKHGIG